MPTSHPDPAAFNSLVWEIVQQIPRGRVTTYGRLAAMIPTPQGMTAKEFDAVSARWVGGAMAVCPDRVPWQRVINSQGKISIRRGGGHLRQRHMLEEEGVEFDAHERIDLAQFGWGGPPQEWMRAKGLLPPPEESQPALPF